MLSPFYMQLCTRFLQPVGLVYNFYPVLASSLFPTASFKFKLNGGYAKTSADFEVMIAACTNANGVRLCLLNMEPCIPQTASKV